MKWVVLIFFLPVFVSAQNVNLVAKEETFDQSLAAFLNTDHTGLRNTSFLTHIDKLAEKRITSKSEESFLRLLFNKTHEKFLKRFDEYASFGALLNKGNYNCLSATAVYALLLHHFEIEYDIIETNYHIFILVNSHDGVILFETTDPVNGFVTDAMEIEKRIKKYKENLIRENGKNYYRLTCTLYKHVQLAELTGLLHYNLAVQAFNAHDLEAAVDRLDKATAIYCSPRMEELTRVVLLSAVGSDMNNQFKEACVRKIQIVRKRNLSALASR
jgi:hypothetical protein